jgi:hypothetical protein
MFLYGKAREMASELEENPVVASAKLLAAASPEIELVKDDRDARTVTFRNVKTGEEFTFSYQDIEEGRVSFSSEGQSGTIEVGKDDEGRGQLTVTTEQGRATFGGGSDLKDFPRWLPVYPGASATSVFSSDTAGERTGAYTLKTGDRLEEVLDYYARELDKVGLQVKSRTTTPAGAFLTASNEGDTRTVSLAASSDGGEVEVMVNFAEKSGR